MALPVRSGDGPPRRRAEEEVIRVDDVWPAIETLIPSIGVLILFYLVLKHILEGDRRERIAQAQWEREHDLRKGAVAPRASSPAAERSGKHFGERLGGIAGFHSKG